MLSPEIRVQPHKKKIAIMTCVSLGIIVMSFMLPLYIIPAYLGVSNASNCAISSSCAGESFNKCGAYQASGDSASFSDSLDKGMKGMLCMMGLDGVGAKVTLGSWTESATATLNKIQVHIH